MAAGQLISWFEPEGSPKSKDSWSGLIAQFFFPTDHNNLDQHDCSVVKQLTAHLRHVLRRERVELAIVGHADYRGSIGYNEELAMRRVKSVTRELGSHLRFEPYFATYWVLAAGERHAVQGTRDSTVLAGDRRVDVFSSTARLCLGDLPQIVKVPQLLRVVHRHFTEIKSTRSDPRGTDWFDPQSVVELVQLLTRDRYDKPRGTEKVAKREYRYVNALYRVNRISIDEKYGWEIISSGPAELETWSTDVTYEWGLPQSMVLVESNTGPHGRRRMWLSREQADKDPFSFPPPLFKSPD